MKYLPDEQATCEIITQLADAVRFAEYELAAGITLAHELGLTWTRLASAMGAAGMASTKQGASQYASRRKVTNLDAAEHDRIARLIGAGDRIVRWEVRIIVEGKPGVTAVRRQTLSQHVKRETAEARCRKRAGAELWKVEPSGKAERAEVRRLRPQPTHVEGAAF